jgi:hypothetical protein
VYAPTTGRLAVAASHKRGDQQAAVHAMKAVLRQAARDADRVFAQGVETLKGRFHGMQLSASLLPADIKRVLALLGELEAVFREANRARSRAGEIFRWTSLFMPIRRTRS